MTFKNSVKKCLTKKIVSYQGRASRSEFWWFFVFFVGCALIYSGIVLYLLKASRDGADILMIPTAVLFFVFVALCCATIRRLHDVNYSGIHLIWIFLPFVGFIFKGEKYLYVAYVVLPSFGVLFLLFLIYLLTKKSAPASNKYGSPGESEDVVLDPESYARLKAELSQAWLEKYGQPYPYSDLDYIPDEHIDFLNEWKKSESTNGVGNVEDSMDNAKNQTVSRIPTDNTQSCPYCGARLKINNAIFCPKCGTSLKN